jgi:ABC-type Fe3+/spermidine/putrescine transport system ATPase subunit
MIEIKDFKYIQNDFKLTCDELKINSGQIVALQGPSGSGKSTFANCILGLENSSQYKLLVDGNDISRTAARDRKFSVVFQGYDLFPHLTVKENIEFVSSNSKSKIPFKVLIETLKISHILNQRAYTLSGGEKQRVALARALYSNPKLIILDEPFSALDLELRDEARYLVKKIINETLVSCLIVTHDPDDIKVLADETYHIQNGEIKKNPTIQIDSILHEKSINSKLVFKGNFLHLWRDEVELSGGVKSFREYIQHPGASLIVPILPNGNLIMIRQFRFAVKKNIFRIPSRKAGLR